MSHSIILNNYKEYSCEYSSNLVAGNIKSGVKIFNVTGSLSAAANLVMTKQVTLGSSATTTSATVSAPIRLVIVKLNDMLGFWSVGTYYGYGWTASSFNSSSSTTSVTIWVFNCKLSNAGKTITISTNSAMGADTLFYIFI